jgi:hypothetical protein
MYLFFVAKCQKIDRMTSLSATSKRLMSVNESIKFLEHDFYMTSTLHAEYDSILSLKEKYPRSDKADIMKYDGDIRFYLNKEI